MSSPTRDHLLDLAFPELAEKKAELPAFFRDTDLNLHFRSFYLNRQRANDTFNEAWALGGWLEYKSGWLADIFSIGATYYTSLPAYAPDSRPGSQLLTPGQDAIGTFGEAWAAFRYKEYALLRGGRQKVDDGYVNPQDSRMVPNTFEALTLSGKLADWFRYDVGYLWTIKPRDSNDFISMSRQAGVPGDGDGMILSAFAFTPIKDLLLYAANYFVVNTYNTVFTKGEYTLSADQGPVAADRAAVHRPAQCGGRAPGRFQHVERRGRRPPAVEGTPVWGRRRTSRVTERTSARTTALGPGTSRCR